MDVHSFVFRWVFFSFFFYFFFVFFFDSVIHRRVSFRPVSRSAVLRKKPKRKAKEKEKKEREQKNEEKKRRRRRSVGSIHGRRDSRDRRPVFYWIGFFVALFSFLFFKFIIIFFCIFLLVSTRNVRLSAGRICGRG